MIGQAVNFLILHAAVVIPVVLVVLLVLFRSVRAVAAGVLRGVARLLLLMAVLALVYDGTRTLAGGSGLVITSLVDHWQALHPASLAAIKVMLTQMHPSAWEEGALRVARLPAWVVAGVLGLTLAWIGRKRRQINVFVN